jgi:amidohydrolase
MTQGILFVLPRNVALIIMTEMEEDNAYVIRMRRYFHEYPELSFEEVKTSTKIREELTALGLEVKPVGKTGLVADIKGSPGRTVALRADMDALPVTEENTESFTSKNMGVMHACGHDAHTAMLLGVARKLSREKAKLHGTVRLIFQAAEEKPPGGAVDFIHEGYLRNVDAIVGQHVTSMIPAGYIATYPTVAMANADEFRIQIHGKGGHGSEPDKAIDALLIATYFVNILQSIVSRMTPAFKPAVVTVGTLTSGYRYNIIAAHAQLTGTVRTFDMGIRAKVKKEIEKLLSGLCASYAATYEYEYIEGYPALVNNASITAKIDEVASEVVGKDHVLHPDPVMGGEDFSYFTKEIPGSFYFLGTGNEAKKIMSPNHSPTFSLDEDALKYGTEVMYRSALKLLG